MHFPHSRDLEAGVFMHQCLPAVGREQHPLCDTSRLGGRRQRGWGAGAGNPGPGLCAATMAPATQPPELTDPGGCH